MQNLVYGMAVLAVRVVIVWMSFLIFQGIRWNELMKKSDLRLAYGVYVMVSIATGHLVGSFMITIIETLQQMVFSVMK